jgi:F-type H+-transporting ATPase subunit gamma
MASMREIKLRIKSIKETKQITKAMKLISAAKLKKARQQLEHTLPYFKKVKETMADILMHSSDVQSPYIDIKHKNRYFKKGYLVFTGDKGLAGGYNHNIIKLAEEAINGDKNVPLYIAGNVGRAYFIKNGYNVIKSFDYPVQNPSVYRAREMAEILLESFEQKVIDELHILYTDLKSSLSMEPRLIKLLPLEIESLRDDLKIDYHNENIIDQGLIYEPSTNVVIEILLAKYIKGIIYGALVEAFTSEQSARMSAMDNATSNADDMLNSLNLYYNRARQAAITQEISEIVGGAAALK